MLRLGVGVITYGRKEALMECVERVQAFTKAPYELVIADDGSTDGSVEWCREQEITTITGRNRGCAWNKNRALYYLLEHTECDPILLLEDDSRMWEPCWEDDWITAAERWHHVNWCGIQDEVNSHSDGSSAQPFRPGWCLGQCTVTTREALYHVGYLDTRFGKFGYEHAEWTRRFARLLLDAWGEPYGTLPCMNCHIGVEWSNSHHMVAEMSKNRRIYDDLMHEQRGNS